MREMCEDIKSGKPIIMLIFLTDNLFMRQKPAKREEKKEAPSMKAPSAKRKAKDGDEEGKKRRPRKKKDPNAPKRAMSGFMFFSNTERDVSCS